MKSLLAAPALGAAAALLIVAGCNGAGTQSQLAPSNTMQTNAMHSGMNPLTHGPSPNFIGGTPKLHPKKGRSWMLPQAVPDNLWYVADTFASSIFIYSWRKLTQEGEITGLSEPYTFCVDKAQDVYIADFGLREVLEYAHGGTTPIKTLSSDGYAIACSVDPTTGNLAVVNFEGYPSGNGSVLVYTGATGTPTVYSAPNLDLYWLAGYDPSGNLFVDGEDPSGVVSLAELPAGGSSFQAITMNVSLGFPGGVQWDGKYLDVGDQSTNTIYQFTVSGSGATEQGSLSLTGDIDAFQFFVPKFGSGKVNPQGNRVIAADFGSGEANKFLYPAGGSPTKTITGLTDPEGVIVSKGKK
ncbi:MAG: hypothetical protein WCC84_08430 [Candidatus Cybelea sp.]